MFIYFYINMFIFGVTVVLYSIRHYITLYNVIQDYITIYKGYTTLYNTVQHYTTLYKTVPFLTIYLGGGRNCPPQGKNLPPPPVKPFLPPKCEAELLRIAVRIAVDLLDNEIMPFHSLLHSHLVCNSYCSSPSI
jgi:hypothetical protein